MNMTDRDLKLGPKDAIYCRLFVCFIFTSFGEKGLAHIIGCYTPYYNLSVMSRL